jgi:hypothetical protein
MGASVATIQRMRRHIPRPKRELSQGLPRGVSLCRLPITANRSGALDAQLPRHDRNYASLPSPSSESQGRHRRLLQRDLGVRRSGAKPEPAPSNRQTFFETSVTTANRTPCSPSPRPSPLGRGGLQASLWIFPNAPSSRTRWRRFSLPMNHRERRRPRRRVVSGEAGRRGRRRSRSFSSWTQCANEVWGILSPRERAGVRGKRTPEVSVLQLLGCV